MIEKAYLGELFNSRIFNNINYEDFWSIVDELNIYEKTYGEKEIITLENDIVSNVGIVVKGEVCRAKISPDGTEYIFRKLIKGRVVGVEIACTTKKTSPYMIYAAKETVLVTFPYEVIANKGLINEDIRLQIMQNVLEIVSTENMRKQNMMKILACKGLRERILIYLHLQKEMAHSDVFTIPYDRQQFAATLCVNRSALSNQLNKMKKEGIIDFKGKQFRINK